MSCRAARLDAELPPKNAPRITKIIPVLLLVMVGAVLGCVDGSPTAESRHDLAGSSANEHCHLDEWGECIPPEEGETDWILAGMNQIGNACPNFQSQLETMYSASPPRIIEASSWPDSLAGEYIGDKAAITVGCEQNGISVPDSPDCKIYLRTGDNMSYNVQNGQFSMQYIMYNLRHEIGHVLYPGETHDQYGYNWSNFSCSPV